MASIGTSVGAFFGALGSGLQSAVTGLTPIIAPALAAALPSLLTPKQRMPAYYPQAMPGGAMPYGYNGYGSSPLSLVPGGPQLIPAGVMAPVGPDAGFLEGLANTTGIGSGNRLPRTVEGKDSRGRTRVYVLAPMVKYRVSISRAGRRRCSGGR